MTKSTSMGTDNLRPPAPGHLVADTIDIKKYYFACYHDDTQSFLQVTLDRHPLEWQLQCADVSPVMIVSWQELSKEEYEHFNGKI